MSGQFARAAVTVLAGLALGACTGYAPTAPRYQAAVPAGSTLVLEQALVVRPGRTRVYLQDGRVLEPEVLAGASRFRPRCWFVVSPNRQAADYTIRPDRFRTGAMDRRVHAQRDRSAARLVAARSMAGLRLAESAGGGPGFLTYRLEIPLTSEEQPAVKRLACRVDQRVGGTREIGQHAIEQALGGIARLEIAE